VAYPVPKGLFEFIVDVSLVLCHDTEVLSHMGGSEAGGAVMSLKRSAQLRAFGYVIRARVGRDVRLSDNIRRPPDNDAD